MIAKRVALKVVALLLAAATAGSAQAGWAQVGSAAPSMRIQPSTTKAISAHVHVIPAEGRPGVPNVGIVVGSRAVLVIESGLGKPSGEIIRDEARRAGDRRLYVIATHSHPEHIGGEQAFPASATILRPAGQQAEVGTTASVLIEAFRGRSADNRSLLADFAFRPADVVFSGSLTLDLGGVTVEIVEAGPAHTDGDIALLVKEDGVLFTGDVVQQNYAPVLAGARSSLPSWLAQIDRLEKLPAQIVVPSHSAITDRRAFGDMRGMVVFVRDRWAEIKAQGLDGTAATDRLLADFKAKYPACGNADMLRMTARRL